MQEPATAAAAGRRGARRIYPSSSPSTSCSEAEIFNVAVCWVLRFSGFRSGPTGARFLLSLSSNHRWPGGSQAAAAALASDLPTPPTSLVAAPAAPARPLRPWSFQDTFEASRPAQARCACSCPPLCPDSPRCAQTTTPGRRKKHRTHNNARSVAEGPGGRRASTGLKSRCVHDCDRAL